MKHGFIKVAAAAPEIRVADPMFNADAVIRAMDEHARLGVKVLVFPELTLTGATCGDLFYQNTLLAGAAAALEKVVQASEGKDMLVFVGLPTTQAQAVAAAKKGAQVLMFGVGPQEAHFEMNTYDIYKKQLTIQGSFINPLTFRDAISLVSSGKMNIGGLISHELELEQVQDFLDGKITGVSKAVVKVGK